MIAIMEGWLLMEVVDREMKCRKNLTGHCGCRDNAQYVHRQKCSRTSILTVTSESSLAQQRANHFGPSSPP